MAVSNNITGALNVVAMILSVPIIGTGIWLASRQDAECVRILRWPLIVIGAILLLVSLAGFVGAFWRVQSLLAVYLIFMFIFIILLLAFVIFAFIVTNKGSGHSVPGRNYKEYQLHDFSGWLRHYVENNNHWNGIKRCLSNSNVCRKLDQRYLSAQDFFNAHISPLEEINLVFRVDDSFLLRITRLEPIMVYAAIMTIASMDVGKGFGELQCLINDKSGCCKPPTLCGYNFVNPTFWINPTNQNADFDCSLWTNDQLQLCYNCNSCKAGLLGNIKKEWKRINIILIVALVALIWVYLIGCSAFRNAQTEELFRRYKERFT